jgi:hypothetical protein
LVAGLPLNREVSHAATPAVAGCSRRLAVASPHTPGPIPWSSTTSRRTLLVEGPRGVTLDNPEIRPAIRWRSRPPVGAQPERDGPTTPRSSHARACRSHHGLVRAVRTAPDPRRARRRSTLDHARRCPCVPLPAQPAAAARGARAPRGGRPGRARAAVPWLEGLRGVQGRRARAHRTNLRRPLVRGRRPGRAPHSALRGEQRLEPHGRPALLVLRPEHRRPAHARAARQPGRGSRTLRLAARLARRVQGPRRPVVESGH